MRGTSHVIVGAAAILALHITSIPATGTMIPLSFAWCLAANMLGSLAPDIDSGESTIRHATGTAWSQGLVGRIVSHVLPGHRGIIHAPLLALAVLALCWWQGSGLALAFAVGWCAHIAADMAMGIIGARNGGLIETALVVLALACVWAWTTR